MPASRLTLSDKAGHAVHIFPTVKYAKQVLPNSASSCAFGETCEQLTYHSGGSVMQPFLSFYVIYWVPPHLQDGSATSMSSGYQTIEKNMVAGYGGHAIAAITTQYYEKGRTTSYVTGNGGLAGTTVDTDAYPSSGCSDSGVPTASNCFNDSQLQTEVKKVMAANGWTGGLNKMFLVFTSSNEGSCFDSGSSSCAYTAYCAYHGAISGSPDIVYSNEPYGNTTNCQEPSTPSPNGDPIADAAATSASHEMTEAITDPLLNAWYDSRGQEIGDECAYIYGTNTWDSAMANQMWGGHNFELQLEYDNHKKACESVGP